MNPLSPIPKNQKVEQEHEVEILRRKEEEEHAQKRAQEQNAHYQNLSFYPVQSDALRVIPQEKAREARVALVRASGHVGLLAVYDLRDKKAAAIIEEMRKKFIQLQIVIVSGHSLEKAWSQYPEKNLHATETGRVELSPKIVENLRKKITTWDDLKEAIEDVHAENASTLLETVLAGALNVRASDVHMETPSEERVSVRLRIDGIMHSISTLDPHAYKLFLTRIKLLSGMKINIQTRIQEGRFSVILGSPSHDLGLAAGFGKAGDPAEQGKASVEIRASVIPSEYGETVVLRILNPESLISIPQLGFRPDFLPIIERQIKKPKGMALVTGPTGSGKTTTLYAFLKEITTPDVKIITIEDPIEYHLDGIVQTQVEPEQGYGFADALRSILRQDPDVILVGEIRDKETAETAIQSALTGHSVFSTLHTNDAAGAIPRLLSLGANAALVGPAINMIIAQRLVRVLCNDCKKKRRPTAEETRAIEEILATFPASLPMPEFSPSSYIFDPGKCVTCHYTGYIGRIGVFEVLEMLPELEELILKNPTITEMRGFAQKHGMSTMQHDALIRVLAGQTSFAEMERVIGEGTE